MKTECHKQDASIRILKEQTLSLDSNTIRIHWIYGLPDSINGAVAKQSESEYMILINADKPEENQTEALEHELLHIVRNDLDSVLPVTVIESEVRKELRSRRKKGMNPLHSDCGDNVTGRVGITG